MKQAVSTKYLILIPSKILKRALWLEPTDIKRLHLYFLSVFRFAFYFYFFTFLGIFSITIHHPYILFHLYPPPSKITVAHVHEFFLFFSFLLTPSIPTPRAVSLLSIYESVSVLPFSSVCLLDSTYE